MYITIYSLKNLYKEAKGLKVGDIVDLIKEPTNEYGDIDAIVASLNGKQVGYVAQARKLDETKSATEIKGEFKDKSTAKVLEVLDLKKEYAWVFKCELIKEKVKTEKKKEKEVKFKISGGFSSFPNKKKLIEDGKISERQVQILKRDNNLIVQYEGIDAGQVTANEGDMQIILEHIEDSPIVTAMAKTAGERTSEAILDVKRSLNVNSIDEEVERVIQEGINTQKEINEKLKYLKDNKVSRGNILLLLQSYIKYPEDIRNRIPSKPKTLYVDSSGLVELSLYYINAKKNLTFEGEKGVGKNVLTETIAWLYNRPLYEFSSNSQHSNNSLLGGQTFVPAKETVAKKETKTLARIFGGFFSKLTGRKDNTEEELTALEGLIKSLSDKNGQDLVFEMSSILEAFINGGILVLDEFNTSLAHVMPIFNSLLDDRRRMEVTGLGLTVGHMNFCAISTQNKDYQGTFESNEATADRFEPIIFPQLESITGVLQAKVPNIDYETMNIANNLYLGIKSTAERGDIEDGALSIRGFISACEVIMLGMDKKQAFINSVANRASDVDDRKAIKIMIDLELKED